MSDELTSSSWDPAKKVLATLDVPVDVSNKVLIGVREKVMQTVASHRESSMDNKKFGYHIIGAFFREFIIPIDEYVNATDAKLAFPTKVYQDLKDEIARITSENEELRAQTRKLAETLLQSGDRKRSRATSSD